MASRLNINWALNYSDSVREIIGKEVSYFIVISGSGELVSEYVIFQSTDHVECKKGFHNWTNKWIHRNFQTSASPQDSDHISQFGQYFVKQEGRAGQEKYDLYWGNTWHLLVEDNSFDYENKNKEMKFYWGLTLRTFWEEQLAKQFGYFNFTLYLGYRSVIYVINAINMIKVFGKRCGTSAHWQTWD